MDLTSGVLVAVLQSLGIYSLYTLAAVIVLRPFVAEWLRTKVSVSVDEAVKRRLASFQLDLDKELENHRTTLGVDAERIRSSLSRDTSDYAIYAQHRHNAVSTLFADLLRAEMLAISFPDLVRQPTDGLTEDAIERLIKRLIPIDNPVMQRHALDLGARQAFQDLDRYLGEQVQNEMQSRVIRARNDAYEAYYRHVLYLPDDVEPIALAICEQFHTLLVEYVAPNDTPNMSRGRVKDELRSQMLKLQRIARADLSRAKPSVAITAVT